jgi:large subunit ribosomal protein L1
MSKQSKRSKAIHAKADPQKHYAVADALTLVKECANAKFDESVDVAVVLGIDSKKSDQSVRGKAAGADVVGFEDLAAKVKEGFMDFDVVIASPDAMRVVGQLGQILGPRGLMPNPKVGTVTPDVVQAVKNAKAGQVQFRADKAGIIHATIGRASFDVDRLKTNLSALIDALNKVKPASSKGIYLRKISVSSTMGIGVRVDASSLSA